MQMRIFHLVLMPVAYACARNCAVAASLMHEIAIRAVDRHAINFARFLLRDIAVAHVVEDAFGVACERIAETAAAGGFEAKHFAGVEHMVGEARRDDAFAWLAGVQARSGRSCRPCRRRCPWARRCVWSSAGKSARRYRALRTRGRSPSHRGTRRDRRSRGSVRSVSPGWRIPIR